MAAAEAMVGSRPGAGSSTMPSTALLSLRAWACAVGAANAAAAASASSARVAGRGFEVIINALLGQGLRL